MPPNTRVMTRYVTNMCTIICGAGVGGKMQVWAGGHAHRLPGLFGALGARSSWHPQQALQLAN